MCDFLAMLGIVDCDYAILRFWQEFPLIVIIFLGMLAVAIVYKIERKANKGRYAAMMYNASNKEKLLVSNILLDGLEARVKAGEISVKQKRIIYKKLSLVLKLPDTLEDYVPNPMPVWRMNWLKFSIRKRLGNKTPVSLPDLKKAKILQLRGAEDVIHTGNTKERAQAS